MASDFVTMGFLLTFLQDTMVNERDYVEIGLNCADICTALDRGMNGKLLDDLSQALCKAINQLTLWVKTTADGLGGLLTMHLITLGLPRISRRRPSNNTGATTLPDLSTRREIRTRSLLGG